MVGRFVDRLVGRLAVLLIGCRAVVSTGGVVRPKGVERLASIASENFFYP